MSVGWKVVAMAVINTVGCGIDTTSGGNFEPSVDVCACDCGPDFAELLDEHEVVRSDTHLVTEKAVSEEYDEAAKSGGSHAAGLECYELWCTDN